MGPHGSLDLKRLSPATVLFGDETSFGLAVSLYRSSGSGSDQRFIFEVNDRQEAAYILDRLGVTPAVVIERQREDAHLSELAEAILRCSRPATAFELSGKASSIQHVSRALKVNGVETRHTRTKAYWAPGKIGLD